jgi:hypothetical protein
MTAQFLSSVGSDLIVDAADQDAQDDTLVSPNQVTNSKPNFAIASSTPMSDRNYVLANVLRPA